MKTAGTGGARFVGSNLVRLIFAEYVEEVTDLELPPPEAARRVRA